MNRQRLNLTPDQERETGRRIVDVRLLLQRLLSSIPACQVAIQAKEGGRLSLRQAELNRIADAIGIARRAAVDPSLLAQIQAAWSELEGLTWLLAMSAARVARREARRALGHGVPVEELEQEGMLGLFDAARRFDPDRSVRFASYARWSVRARLTHCSQRAAALQISSAVFELYRNLGKLISAEEKVGRRLAPAADVADRLGVRPGRLREVMAAGALRAVEGGPDSSLMIDEIGDPGAGTPEEVVARADQAAWLRAMLHTRLAERERSIMERRYGIDCEESSVADIAGDLGLSTERVRQLEAQSRAALRELSAREMSV